MGDSSNQVLGCVLVALPFFAAGCQTNSTRVDLAINPVLYQSPGYETRVLVDKNAFIAPLIDAREPAAEATGPMSFVQAPESVWERPMTVMVEEILVDELRKSGIFSQVLINTPSPSTLIVTPYLVSARYGEEELTAKRRAIAEIEIRIVVHGAVASASESRPILFDRTFHEVTATPPAIRAVHSAQILGVSLSKAVRAMLAALDQSNVSRSGVPMDPAVSGQPDTGR